MVVASSCFCVLPGPTVATLATAANLPAPHRTGLGQQGGHGAGVGPAPMRKQADDAAAHEEDLPILPIWLLSIVVACFECCFVVFDLCVRDRKRVCVCVCVG